jgi:hypothetical protein
MTFPAANYTVQSIALHELMVKATRLDPPKPIPTILFSASFLEIVAGFLYVLSSIPAIRKEGFWFFKMEKNGSIRPNARTLIPAFVLIYMGSEFFLSSLVKLESHPAEAFSFYLVSQNIYK